MSEFSPRPLWQVPAALIGSIAMVAAATHFRENIDREPVPLPAEITATTLPNASTTIATPETTTTTSPEFLGPAEQIEEGFLVDDRSLRFSAELSRGVDCQKSYESDGVRSNNEIKAPLGLISKPTLLGESRSIMFFGEETSKPRFGNNKLSHGWAIEYKQNSEEYIVYKFEVEPTAGNLQGRAMGRPVKILTESDLRSGAQELFDETMVFSARIAKDASGLDGEYLYLTIRCKDRG